MLNLSTVDPAHEDEFIRWYHDHAVGSFAKRTRRAFWRVYP